MPAGAPPDLACIIVSYNVRELLAGCLRSVEREVTAAGVPAAVYVVDNASGDGSAEMVRREFPAVRLIASETNLGFAAGNNAALRALGFHPPVERPQDFVILRPSASEAEESPGPNGQDIEILRRANGARLRMTNPTDLPRYVMLLNPDAELAAGALSAWLAAAEACPAAGVVGPALRYPDGGFQHAAFRFPDLLQIALDLFPPHRLPLGGRLLDSRLNGRYPRPLYGAGQPFPVDHPLGAAMLVRGEAIEDAGLLDEGFFIYAEEVDWCMRMRAAGWGAMCAPAAVVVHHEARSTRQFSEAMFVQLWRSRLRLFALHYGRRFNAAARALLVAGLARQRGDALREHAAGALDDAGLARRLAAYAEVSALLAMPPERFLP